MLRVVPKIRRAREVTEEPVDGGGCNVCFASADRFRHARGGFAGRRGQRDPRTVAVRLLVEQRQDIHYRPCLAGARTAGDDGEMVRYGSGRGQLLQVGLSIVRRG